jgi:hypothetical protein
MDRKNCRTSSLDYESLPLIQNSITKTQFYEYPSLTSTSLDETVPIEFRVDRTDQFIDLTQTYLSFTFSVLKSHETDLLETDLVSTVNNFGYSVFSEVELFIQGKKITSTQGNYPFLSYIRTLLETSEEEKKNYLRSALWFKDTPGFMDTIAGDEGARNDGWIARAGYIAKSNSVEIFVKICLDFTIDQLIPSQTELFFRFHRSPPSLCLLADSGDFKVKISQAKLMVAKQTLSQHANLRISNLLNRGLLLPATRFQVRTKVVSKNDQNCDWIPFSGRLPHRVYFCQVLSKAYNGAINKNIFNFKTFDLKRVHLLKNGEGIPFDQPIERSSTAPLMLYMVTLNSINRSECICFNSFEYRVGYMIGCFDLTKENMAGNTQFDSGTQMGTVRLKLDYEKALAEAATVICIGEFSDVLQIDSGHNPAWISESS